jgi:hypothetical protein
MWLANKWPIIVILVIIAGYIFWTVKAYVGRKSNVLGRSYK